MDPRIPKCLIEAKAVVEAELSRSAALRQTGADMGADAAAAAARLAQLDPEIAKLRDILLADDALEGVVAADLRMAAASRAEARAKFAALSAERSVLQQQIDKNQAGQAALSNIAGDRTQLVEAAEVFLREKRAYDAELIRDFSRDVGRQTLPHLFEKWFAIAAGIGNLGIIERLNSLHILPLGNPPAILFRGAIYDPDTTTTTDWTAAWQEDAALVELHQALAEFAALERRVAPILAAERARRRQQEDDDRRAERMRHAAEHPRPQGYSTSRAIPPVPADANQGRPVVEPLLTPHGDTGGYSYRTQG